MKRREFLCKASMATVALSFAQSSVGIAHAASTNANLLAIEEYKKIIDDLLDPCENEMFAMLEEYVNHDSFSFDAEGVNALGEKITTWLKKEGFYVNRLAKIDIPDDEQWLYDLGDAFMAKTHQTEEAGVGFIAHMDTVFPKGTAAERPFFIDRENDIAKGPGVADMKAGLIANMFAARALKQSNLMPCPMTLMFSPDEELGSPTGQKQLGKYLKGARAVMCSEPGGEGDVVTVSRKGSGHMHLKVEGVTAHAGKNYADGSSAILEIAEKTLAINKFVDLSKSMTVNTGLISGGSSANSIAPYAESRIHLTYQTLAEGEELVAKIREVTATSYIPNTKSTISGGLRLYPFERSQKGDELFDIARNVGAHLGMDLKGQHYESAAESGFCSSMGIPTLCCMGPEGDYIHSDKEYMRPSTFLQRTKLIALTALMSAYHFQNKA